MYIEGNLVKFKGIIKKEEPLAPYLTIKVGGKVEWFLIPDSIDDAVYAVEFFREMGYQWFVLGNGSKILIPDEGFSGGVIYTGRLKGFWLDGDGMILESGSFLGDAIRVAMTNNLSGIESLVGIPATIGGAVVMNAGTRYGCIGDVVEKVEMIDEDGRYVVTTKPRFGYRDSEFKRRGIVITRVYLKLRRDCQGEIEKRLRLAASLRRVQPQFSRQFGCIFKNPLSASAGRLIEEAGFKGFRYNNVQISSVHSNFLLNFGDSANDIYYVIRLIQEEIYRRFNIFLEPEVNIIGF